MALDVAEGIFENFRTMVEVCRSHGAQVAIIPLLPFYGNYSPPTFLWQLFSSYLSMAIIPLLPFYGNYSSPTFLWQLFLSYLSMAEISLHSFQI